MTRLAGCGTALVTPFARDGSIDERALRSLAEWQITEGVHFLADDAPEKTDTAAPAKASHAAPPE